MMWELISRFFSKICIHKTIIILISLKLSWTSHNISTSNYLQAQILNHFIFLSQIGVYARRNFHPLISSQISLSYKRLKNSNGWSWIIYTIFIWKAVSLWFFCCHFFILFSSSATRSMCEQIFSRFHTTINYDYSSNELLCLLSLTLNARWISDSNCLIFSLYYYFVLYGIWKKII